jgi:hypothetical protein
MDHDIKKAENIKLILSTFEQFSRLKLIFRKSELLCFGEAQGCFICQASCVQSRTVCYYVFGYSDSLLETNKHRMETCRESPTKNATYFERNITQLVKISSH